MIDPLERREPERSLCFCGQIVIGAFICPACAQTMTAALLRAATLRSTASITSASPEPEPVAV